MIRKYSLRLIFLASLCAFSTQLFASDELVTVEDLSFLKQEMSDSQLPVLMLFTTENCHYCEAIRENYLIPMLQSGEYHNRILFRQLYMGEYNLIRNEQGKLVSGDQLALKYAVDVSPTILFLDAEGNEVAQRIVGVSTQDYFDKTLQQHISAASQ